MESVKQTNGYTTTACGSPDYAAPELLSKRSGEEQSYLAKNIDMWALGIVTYICLTQTSPFHDDKMDVLFDNVINREPEYICKPFSTSESLYKLSTASIPKTHCFIC